MFKINGTHFVVMSGLTKMQWLFAENLDTLSMVNIIRIQSTLHYRTLQTLLDVPTELTMAYV